MEMSGAAWSSDSESKIVICGPNTEDKISSQLIFLTLFGWRLTHCLSVVHTLQKKTVEMGSFCRIYRKDIWNSEQKILLDVWDQLPERQAEHLCHVQWHTQTGRDSCHTNYEWLRSVLVQYWSKWLHASITGSNTCLWLAVCLCKKARRSAALPEPSKINTGTGGALLT